jgi:hypothetical protein
MPLVRYFFFVGGALLALLFVSDAYLPKPPDVARADADLPVIRIHSDRKWPERLVFDTSRQTIVPVQMANAGAAATAADVSAKARLREAFAQLQPPDQPQAQAPVPAKPELKLQQKHKVAKRRAAPPVMLVAQQPQFGIFGNNTW